ncbi:protein phosphatase Slingshot homolog 2-like isoform X2 [Megalops cyprinoides]|uniref:protein phosphatase Slingshot homolog 2-like isoform X2 n=1 Tax=Megalops cyprinoides TaxID=118141 RepID=UPI0018651E26|nr:protein phosphatase Slingshot homolog 2-like isoform X2 [Megalops cyprinoides]
MALVTVQRSPTPSATSSPCVSEADSGEEERRAQPRSISESFLTVKGAALFLPRGNGSSSSSVPLVTQRRNKHAGDLQQHLQTMFTVLRPEDTIRLAVRLESAYPQCTRYMVVVSTNGRQDTEESVVLGMDFSSSENTCSVGLVLPLWSDTLIHLDGDGGFSVSTVNRVHVFKPVSVQAMWSALQSLHKACEVARCHNYYPGSLFLTWVSYYQSRVSSDQACINEWNAMQDVQSHRADSPVLFTDVPTERERTERLIKTRLREIMMQKDLENVTSKEIRTELEMQMVCNLREFKEFIDNEMIVILGQMDSPTEIFDHVFLGSEWNASNLEELQTSGVRYILNVTREIDNFFPGLFEYHNIRVYDEEATDLLAYWNDTYKFISKAKKAGVKCLVHCKMGVSRSASTVIAYAMKEYGWDLEQAFDYVKERRGVTKPNPSFMRQLEEYQGILLASKQRHNKLWRSHSDSDLSERHEPLCKTPHTLGRSDPHNNNNNAPPSLQDFLGVADLQALTANAEASTAGTLLSDARADPQTNSNRPDLPAPNGVCGSEENLSPTLPPLEDLPALPRPQAATVVPEERVDNSLLTVAVTVPLGNPHPPPSLTLLPPSPSPSAELKLEAPELLPLSEAPSELSASVPEEKPDALQLSLPVLELTRGAEPPSHAEGPHELSVLVPDHRGGGISEPLGKLEPIIQHNPSEPHLVLGPQTNDDNNNPSGAELQTVAALPVGAGSAALSADRIDFFSAREKFLGLSQEGAAHSHSEQALPQTPQPKCPSQELQPGPLEDPSGTPAAEEGQRKGSAQPEETADSSCGVRAAQRAQQENGVCVRHIVTELESISQTAAGTPAAQRKREDGEGEAGAAEVLPGSPSPPSQPGSPSTPPCEWPPGSVRRVTKQLEQRLRQELDCAPAASPPPPSEPRRPRLPTLGRDRPKRRASSPEHPPTDPGAEGEEDERGRVEQDGRGFIKDTHASPHPAPAAPEPDPSGSFLKLEGVTELETNTDGPPHSGDLEQIQDTLRELQAFLHEGGAPEEERAPPSAEPEGQRERGWESAAQRGPVEMEIRIRQAGLTLPSLMKRSASLAKLGCLELNPDDLSDWDADSPPPQSQQLASPPPSHPHAAPDDASKKQRVLPLSGPGASPPPSPTRRPRAQECVRTGAPSPPPSLPAQRRRRSGPQDADRSQAPPLVSVATRQQHGRTHPLRRLKKLADKSQTHSFLYSTM